GVVFDIDPVFANTEEWYEAIPAEVRPHKDQPFYHLFAENDETEYVAHVSEQNLLPDTSGEPVRHPQVAEVFIKDGKGGYRRRAAALMRDRVPSIAPHSALPRQSGDPAFLSSFWFAACGNARRSNHRSPTGTKETAGASPPSA